LLWRLVSQILFLNDNLSWPFFETREGTSNVSIEGCSR
jgi:hypothetical protein